MNPWVIHLIFSFISGFSKKFGFICPEGRKEHFINSKNSKLCLKPNGKEYRILRTDKETEYMADVFEDFCCEHGSCRQPLSINAVVKSMDCMVMDHA